MLDSGLPHGKHVDHLNVAESAATADALLPREMVATYVAVMVCENSPTPPTWGVLLAHVEHPERGMHLFPDAAEWLPGMLVAEAVAHPMGDIDIEHTKSGPFEVWAKFTPAGAIDVSDRIKAAIAGAP